MVNNVRDLETDRRAGKQTLAVKLGREATRRLFVAMTVLAFAALIATLAATAGPWWAALGLLAAPLARRPIRAVTTRTDGAALNQALADTGLLLGAFSLLISIGLVI